MNKTELVAAMVKQGGMTNKEAWAFVGAFTDTVFNALAHHDQVGLVGFGTWYARYREARVARNILTGGTMRVPAKWVPGFRPGKPLKIAVTQNKKIAAK